jgi:hypothetical protein
MNLWSSSRFLRMHFYPRWKIRKIIRWIAVVQMVFGTRRNEILITVTETKSKEDLDQFVEAVRGKRTMSNSRRNAAQCINIVPTLLEDSHIRDVKSSPDEFVMPNLIKLDGASFRRNWIAVTSPNFPQLSEFEIRSSLHHDYPN